MENNTTSAPTSAPQPVTPAPTPKQGWSTGKKVLVVILIVIGLIVLVGGGLALYVGKKIADNVDITDDGITVTGENGEQIMLGQKLPANWPSTIPTYPQAQVAFAGNSVEEGKDVMVAVFASQETPDAIIAYYRSELASRGWKLINSASSGTSSALQFENSTHELFVDAAASGQDGTAISIAVRAK